LTRICQGIGERGLNTSPKLRTYIPLPSTSSYTRPSLARRYSRISLPNGYLFSGEASGLDAFSPYPQWRSYPAVQAQPVHQRPQRIVPFVLDAFSPQVTDTFSRYRPYWLAPYLTQLTWLFNE